MSKPVIVDLPHNLGTEEAKRRMQNGIGKLKDHVPGGAAEVEHSWTGDRMHLRVRAMGQEVVGQIDVQDKLVRFEVLLPPFLAFFAGKVEALMRSRGGELLEDKSKRG